MVRVRWGQAERYCGEVGGRSDESAPDNDSPGVYTSGKVHGRCYRMRMLDQINALVAVADGSGYQTERHCGKVGGRSDESAPANDTLGVYTAGQVHGR